MYINHVISTHNERLTSGFGRRNNPTGSGTEQHNGADFVDAQGLHRTSDVGILAIADGKVVEVINGALVGWTVSVAHEGGILSRYQHMKDNSVTVKIGDTVRKGQTLGIMGTTGRSTGVHLHIGIQAAWTAGLNGRWADPEPYLRGEKIIPGTGEKISDADLDILHRIAWAEARGEDDKGIILIVNVIMNRVKSPQFPNGIRDVIFAPNQFSPVKDGAFDRATPNERIKKAVNRALSGEDYSRGALFFRTIAGADGGWHERSLTRLFDHGAHRFYAAIGAKPAASMPLKSLDEIAREVIRGNWGNGQERRDRLAAAGYDFATVQARVNELVK